MYLFFTDETNLKMEEKFDFFIYGGIVVPETEIRKLSIRLREIKKSLNIPAERPVKWPNKKWKKEKVLDSELHKKVKELFLKEFLGSDCRIIIYLSPQVFYHTKKIKSFEIFHTVDYQKYKQSLKYALNVCSFKFDQLLQKEDSSGVMIVDRFETGMSFELGEYCKSLYPHGGDYPINQLSMPIVQMDNEDNILMELNDVILGSIYYSMREESFNVLPDLRPSFCCNNDGRIRNFGINIYPKHPKTKDVEERIEKVRDKFFRLLSEEKQFTSSKE